MYVLLEKDDGVDAVETAIMIVEEDEEEDSIPMRIMRTSTKMKVVG